MDGISICSKDFLEIEGIAVPLASDFSMFSVS